MAISAISVELIDRSDEVKEELAKAVETALEEIGLAAEGYAKLACPVDTGRLRNSISHAVDGKAAIIGTNVEYAPYVELGTSRMSAQPYLRPAVLEHIAEYKHIAESRLRGE